MPIPDPIFYSLSVYVIKAQVSRRLHALVRLLGLCETAVSSGVAIAVSFVALRWSFQFESPRSSLIMNLRSVDEDIYLTTLLINSDDRLLLLYRNGFTIDCNCPIPILNHSAILFIGERVVLTTHGVCSAA